MKQETAQHTPGPWTSTDTGIFSQHLNAHGNFYVCTLPFPSVAPSQTETANLRLMALSPELLEALEDCRGVLQSLEDQLKGKSVAVTAVLAKANAILTKATQP